MAKMREMGYTEFSRDDARVALKEYGHDHPVEAIVTQMILDRPWSTNI